MEKSSEKKGVEEGPSKEPSIKGKESSGAVKGKGIAEASMTEVQASKPYEKEEAPELIHAYLCSEEERHMYLHRPNLCPEASEMIIIRFEKTAQDRSRVFSNVPIRRILDVSTQFFAYKNVSHILFQSIRLK